MDCGLPQGTLLQNAGLLQGSLDGALRVATSVPANS